MTKISQIAFSAASLALIVLSLALVINGAITVIAGLRSSWADAATRCSPRSSIGAAKRT